MRYVVILGLLWGMTVLQLYGQDRWTAPQEADTLQNLYKSENAQVIAQGKELYTVYCSSCHGSNGDGMGGAGQSFNPPPADFTSERVQRQSDGAIFWKIRKGNPPGMLSYKDLLSEQEVWQLVTYLRQFKPE